MGPKALYLGPKCPSEDLIWQDAYSTDHHSLIGVRRITHSGPGAGFRALVAELWRRPGRRPPPIAARPSAAAPNGARLRLAPQNQWEVNQPEQLARVLAVLAGMFSSVSMPLRLMAGPGVAWRI